MNPLEIIVLIGVLVLLGAWLGPRMRVPAPLLQLALGLLVGFVPIVREIHLPSEAVLVLFLPALLFWESLTTSLREIRRDLRGILILSTLLVVASAFGVAGIGVALGSGMECRADPRRGARTHRRDRGRRDGTVAAAPEHDDSPGRESHQ